LKNREAVERAVMGAGPLTATIEFEPYDTLMLRPDYLLDLFQDKKVIHLGCADHLEILNQKIDRGNYLHNLLSCVSSRCIGIDINKEAVQAMTDRGIKNAVLGDITCPGIKPILNDKWDYILLGEVLEHLDHPAGFLRSLIKNYGKHINRYVVTVPNAFGLPFILNALENGKEQINSDHCYWFTPYTILKVLHHAGLKLEEMQMCVYENSAGIIKEHRELLKSKPLLLDTIVAVCSAS